MVYSARLHLLVMEDKTIKKPLQILNLSTFEYKRINEIFHDSCLNIQPDGKILYLGDIYGIL